MNAKRAKQVDKERESRLTGKAYLFIKEAIINYHLKPGAALGLNTLATTLKMSQTPIREALIRLEQEQFIHRRGKKGFTVAAFTLDQIRELYDLRVVLETAAIRWAAEKSDRSHHKKIEKTLVQTDKSLKSGTRKGILNREHHFHALILQAGSNDPLWRMGRVILDRVRLIQNLNLLTSDRLNQAHEQHRGVYEALKNQDPESAVGLMEHHLNEARDYLLSRLENENDILSLLLSDLSEAEVKS